MLYAICGKKRTGKDEAGNFVRETGNFNVYALADEVKNTLEVAGKRFRHTEQNIHHPFSTLAERKTLWEGDRDNGILLVSNTDVIKLFLHGVEVLESMGCSSVCHDEELHHLIYEAYIKNDIPWTARRIMQQFGTDVVCNMISPAVWTEILINRILTLGEFEDTLITDCRQEHEYKYLRKLGAKFIFIERESQSEDCHETEKGLTPSEGDVVILNNGTLDELKSQILKHIKPSV